MKKILLVNVDSKIPNLALEKIRIYHKQQKDKVIKIKDKSTLPLFIDSYDKIYVSCIFDYNKHRCKKWEGIAEIGGSGYDLKKRLPFKIEKIKPHINYGFTTRGCIRNCPWCIVPKKEGKIHVVGDVYDLWDGAAKNIIIMDNNILAAPEHFFKIANQLKKENLAVDFNQGLDHRLLTDRICQELFSLNHCGSGKIRFAFDHISYKKSVIKAIRILKKNGLKDWRTRWYIYIGLNDTVETVLDRINIIRDAKQAVFVMRDRNKKVQKNLEFKKMYAWGCNISTYVMIPFSEYTINKGQFIKNNKPTLF